MVMKESVKKEVEKLIKKYGLNCSVNDFRRKAEELHTYHEICCHHRVSEEFAEEFKDEVDWWGISQYLDLSEKFIVKFQDRLIPTDNIRGIKKKLEDKKAIEIKKLDKLRQKNFPQNAILILEL